MDKRGIQGWQLCLFSLVLQKILIVVVTCALLRSLSTFSTGNTATSFWFQEKYIERRIYLFIYFLSPVLDLEITLFLQ